MACVAFLTREIGNTEERDAVAEIVLEESVVGRAIARTRAPIERAWASSRTARATRRAASVAESKTPIERLRAVCGMALVAAVSALALRFLAGRPAPLVWIVPSVVAIGAAAVLIAARTVAEDP